jgi:hypothetical protein
LSYCDSGVSLKKFHLKYAVFAPELRKYFQTMTELRISSQFYVNPTNRREATAQGAAHCLFG